MTAGLAIDRDGRLQLPPAQVRQLGGGSLELLSSSDRHLFCAVPAGDGEVVLSGRLGALGIADLLSFFNLFRQTGLLRLLFDGGEKQLLFRQGEVISATSTFAEDDLGEVLYGLGKIDRETLLGVRRRLGSGGAWGKTLVEIGAVAPKDLWLASRQQVEAIVLSLFAAPAGSFVFVTRAMDDEPAIRLSMNTQNLIMEGLRRADEKALFLRRIPSPELVAVWLEETGVTLTPVEERLAALVRAARISVRELTRRSGLGEFDGLRHLHALIEKGVIRLDEPPTIAPVGRSAEILTIFNAALGAVCRRGLEQNPRYLAETGELLRALPHPFSYVFREVSLGRDGTVDGGRVMANLTGLDEEDRDRLLADALGELLFLACENVRRELGAEESAALARRVRDIAQRVKNLIGRTG